MPKKKKGQNVKIYARVRPLMPWEPKTMSLSEHGNKLRNKTSKTENEYSFSKVFGMNDTNEYMFKVIVEPMIDNVLNGFNAILIAYGQTGSGKTYSMLGKPHLKIVGLLPYMLKSIVESPNVKKLELLAVEAFGHHVARIELFDLYDEANQTFVWADKKGDTGLEPHKAKKVEIKNIDDAYEKIKFAHRGSHFAPTGKNPESSRGHVTFIARVTQSPPNDPTTEQTSYFIMLDCAGSEGESAFTKEFIASCDKTTLMARRLEAGCINTGLSQLQIIFNELRVKGSLAKMIGNGLRRVLHPYINTKTFLAVLFTFSPARNNAKATESTLKFAVTAGMVKVNPVKAELTTNLEALVKQLRQQIEENEKKMEEQSDRLTEVQNEFEKIKQEALNINDLKDFDFHEEEEEEEEYVEEEIIDENGKKKTIKKLKPRKVQMNKNLLSELEEFDDIDETTGFDLGKDFESVIEVKEDVDKEMEKAIKQQEQIAKGGDLIKQVIDVDDKDKNKTYKAMKQLEETLNAGHMDVTMDEDEREEYNQSQKKIYNYVEKNEEEIKEHIEETWQEIDVTKEEQTKLKKQQNNVVDHLTETNEWLFSTLSEVLSE